MVDLKEQGNLIILKWGLGGGKLEDLNYVLRTLYNDGITGFANDSSYLYHELLCTFDKVFTSSHNSLTGFYEPLFYINVALTTFNNIRV